MTQTKSEVGHPFFCSVLPFFCTDAAALSGFKPSHVLLIDRSHTGLVQKPRPARIKTPGAGPEGAVPGVYALVPRHR